MWLFYVYANYIPMGSDGEMKVPSSVKSMLSLRKLAAGFLGKRPGKVYCVRQWTQQMCEMNALQFVTYIIQHGQIVARSEDC